MTACKPYAAYPLLDAGRQVAVIRYDGDPDVFTALAWQWLLYNDSCEATIEPPQPRLYRMNPSRDPEYAWMLGRPDRPGRGVFLGAVLTIARPGELSAYQAPSGCWRCDAEYGELHLTTCPTLRTGTDR